MKTIYYYQTFIGLNKLLTHSQDIDVIIGPTISELAILRNNLKNIPAKVFKDNKKFKDQFSSFKQFLYKALVGGQIDKFLDVDDFKVEPNSDNASNVVQLSV